MWRDDIYDFERPWVANVRLFQSLQRLLFLRCPHRAETPLTDRVDCSVSIRSMRKWVVRIGHSVMLPQYAKYFSVE